MDLLEVFATGYRNQLVAVLFERTLWDEPLARSWLRAHGLKSEHATMDAVWIEFPQGCPAGPKSFEVELSPGRGVVLGVVNGSLFPALARWKRVTLEQLDAHDWPLAEAPSLRDFDSPEVLHGER